MKPKKTKWIMYLCCLIAAISAVVGVSALAKTQTGNDVMQVSIKQGSTKKLTWKKISKKNRKKIRWQSLNTKIASVDSHGTVKAKQQGKATVIAMYQKKTQKYKITVYKGNANISQTPAPSSVQTSKPQSTVSENGDQKKETVTEGTKSYRGFVIDNVLHSSKNGNIHYNIYPGCL